MIYYFNFKTMTILGDKYETLNQLAIILGLWALGEYISSFIQGVVVIPGSIIGMILFVYTT